MIVVSAKMISEENIFVPHSLKSNTVKRAIETNYVMSTF